MRELLDEQYGGADQEDKDKAGNGSAVDEKAEVDGAPLAEEEVEVIRRRTAAFLLGEGR